MKKEKASKLPSTVASAMRNYALVMHEVTWHKFNKLHRLTSIEDACCKW